MYKWFRYLALIAIFGALAPAARADIKVDCALWIDQGDWKMLQEHLPADQRAKLAQSDPVFRDGGVRMAIYESGPMARIDTPNSTVIYDPAAGYTVINPSRGLYVVLGKVPASQQNYPATVQRTSQTKVVMGHPAHLYKITVTGDGFAVAADDWVADDLPFRNLVGSANSPLMRAVWSHIKGLPLWSTIIFAFGDHTIRINYEVQAISTKPLPASTFAVPSGFRRINPPANNSPAGKGDPYHGEARDVPALPYRSPLLPQGRWSA